MTVDRHIDLVGRTTAAFADEIDRHAADEPIPWPWWPDVGALVGHLGVTHRWAAAVVRTGREQPDPANLRAPKGREREWYLECRRDPLDAVCSVPADAPAWVFAGADATAAFWRRRMAYETTKHLIDLRAAGGGAWRVVPELDPADYADGIDEFLAVFLARSRPSLPPLPSAVVLAATDTERRWSIDADWRVGSSPTPAAAEIRATTADLALVLWDRADPVSDDRYRVTDEHGSVAALRDAPIHT